MSDFFTRFFARLGMRLIVSVVAFIVIGGGCCAFTFCSSFFAAITENN